MRPTVIVGIGSAGQDIVHSVAARFGRVSLVVIDSDAATGQPIGIPEIHAAYSAATIELRSPWLDIRDVPDAFDSQAIADILRHPDRLYRMRPEQFEDFVGAVYAHLGYEVHRTPRSHDHGVDLVLERTLHGMRHRYVVQCKHTRLRHRTVGVGTARDLLGALIDWAGTAAILVTNTSFSRAVKKLASRHASRLFCVDGAELMGLMHACVETA